MILKKPCETPSRLNLAHPHAQGLVASYLFNGQGSKVFDYTCNQNELSVVGASYVADGVQVDANGEYASLDNTNQIINSEVGTIIIWFKSLSSIADSVIRGLFGYRPASGPVNGTFVVYKHPTLDDLFFMLRDTSNRYVSIDGALLLSNWQSGFCVAVQWDRNAIIENNRMEIAINGERIVPNASAGQTGWSTFTVNSTLYVGNTHPTDAIVSNGIISQVNIYNTVLSESTLKNIHQDQYAMFDVYSNIIFSFLFSVFAPLVIITQPENITVAKETDASFSIEATGSGTLTYQWYRNSELQAGETSSTYSFTTALSNNNDSVYCIVSDDNSSLQSDTVFLTVVSCVMNTNADALEEKDYPIPQKIEYKEDYEK